MTRPELPALLLLAVLGLALAVSAAPAVDRSAAAGWWRTTDGRLSLVSDLPPRQAGELLDLLTALRRVVGGLLFVQPVEIEAPVTVIVFSDAATYEPFRLYGRDGQFLATPYESLVVVNAASARRPMLRIAAHEFLHALVAGAGLDLPLWAAEGLAEFYSTARVGADRMVVGEPGSELQSLLRGRPFLPFGELLTLSAESPDYLEEPRAERFYAQSWLLVHYLLSRPGGGERLDGLLRQIEAGADPVAALGAAVESHPSDLERRLRLYLNTRSLPRIEIPLPARRAEAPWAGRALEEGDLAAVLAILATEQLRWERSPDRVSAVRDWVDRAVSAAPADGDRLGIEARFYQILGQRKTAGALYERSVYLDARRARTYAYYARFLVEANEEDDESTAGGRSFEQARLALGRALELAPSHPWLLALERRLDAAVRSVTMAAPEVSPRP